jgi:hypothetical protein
MIPWRLYIPMSDVENEEPTNANGKRVNALELGPRKKAYIFLLQIPQLLHRSDKPLLGPSQIR